LAESKAHKRLSISELKQHKGLENLSEEEAENAISTLEKYAVMMYELYKKEQLEKEEKKK
jgi:hypothetical protein